MASFGILCPSPQGSWGKEHFTLSDSLLCMCMCVCVCVCVCVCLVLDSSLATAWGDFTQRGINTNLVFPGGWGERVSTFTRQVRIIIICPRRGVGVGECPLVLDLRWGRNSAASEFHLLPFSSICPSPQTMYSQWHPTGLTTLSLLKLFS